MKKKRTVMALGIAAAVCLVCLAFAIFRQPPASGNQTAEEWMQIPSRYHVFSYPKIWENHLRVETEEKTEYTVAFYGVINEKEQRLFDFVFGQQPEGKIGSLKMENGQSIAVGIVTYDMLPESRWQPEEWELLCAMQEDINVILQNMPLVLETAAVEPLQAEEIKDLTVETPYGSLRYPAKWADYITTEQTDGQIYTVTFYASGEGFRNYRLFDVFFGGEEGVPMGQLVREQAAVTVRVRTYEAKRTEGLSDSAVQTICAMQEDVNVLFADLPLQSLEQEREEVQQPQIPAGDTDEDLIVETAYCRLHFPLKWEEALQIVHGEDGDRTVAFYGQLRPEKRQKLFSVGFDVAEGSPVGTISDGSGRPVTVSVLLTEFHPDSGWTEEEADIIYEMQEAVNYLIQKLPLT